MGHFLPVGIKLPRIRIEVWVKMDITKGINDIGICRDNFVVDVYLRSKIASHRCVWLRQASRLTYDGVKHWDFVFPSFKRNGAELLREGAWRCWVCLWRRIFGGAAWISVDQWLYFCCGLRAPVLMSPKKSKKPWCWNNGSWRTNQWISAKTYQWFQSPLLRLWEAPW